MNKKEILNELYTKILSQISDNEFVWIKSKELLRKKRPAGFQSIQIFPDPIPNGFEINLTIGIRINKIEDIVNKFRKINPLYLKDTETHVVSYGMLNSNLSFRWPIRNNSELENTVAQIVSFLNSKGLGYLSRYECLSELNELYNNTPLDFSIKSKTAFSKALVGLSLARLLGESNFEELVARYSNELEMSNDKLHFPEPFNQFVNYLRTMPRA